MILSTLTRSRRGFTLVEIMLVLAIIGLLAAIGLPNWIRSRKRSQATRILNDLRVIDHALVQWAMDNGRIAGDLCTLEELRGYLKRTDTPLYDFGVDVLNNPYGPFVADMPPVVNALTFVALADVAGPEFWIPYQLP